MIRPEDIGKYDELGIDLFKFIGREIADVADWEKILKAYCNESYDGNLLDLVHGFVGESQLYIDNKSLEGYIEHFFKSPFECYKLCGTGECVYCSRYLQRALK